MKIYTVIGIYEDVMISEYGSYLDKEQALQAADNAHYFENSDIIQNHESYLAQAGKDEDEWTEEELRQEIAMDGTVIHIIESELQEN